MEQYNEPFVIYYFTAKLETPGSSMYEVNM